MEAHISRSESASGSATSEVTAGAGVIGGPIGTTESLFMITIGTTLGANTFYNHNNYYRGGDAHGGFRGDRGGDRARSNEGNRPPNSNVGGRDRAENRPRATARPFEGNNNAARGYAEPRGQSGTRSGAFSGYGHGGETRGYSSRGEVPASAAERVAAVAAIRNRGFVTF